MTMKGYLVVSLAVGLSACQTLDQNPDNIFAEYGKSVSPHNIAPDDPVKSSVQRFGASDGIQPSLNTTRINGSGNLIGNKVLGQKQSTEPGDANLRLNLVNAPIDVAAKSVLDDLLEVSYFIDPNVAGRITIQTAKPATKTEVAELFQNALHANGATIVKDGNLYRIETLDQARSSAANVEIGMPSRIDGRASLGSAIRIIPLHYVSASEIRRVLEPTVSKGSILSADDDRNTITLSGNAQDLSGILDMISVFDVDTMKGMSFAIIPVQAAQPDDIADELRKVFGSDKGASKGMVNFIPNNRLKSILVISQQKTYLARAENWVKRLDARAKGEEKQLYTFRVENRPAKELVDLVNDIFTNKIAAATPQSNVAPRFQTAVAGQLPPGVSADGVGPEGGVTPPDSNNSGQAAIQNSTGSAGATPAGEEPRIKITADQSNNSLLIYATAADYKRVERILQNLDVAPRQVLIEATIAEVALTDDLKFGVRWYLENQGSKVQLTDATTNDFGSVFPMPCNWPMCRQRSMP